MNFAEATKEEIIEAYQVLQDQFSESNHQIKVNLQKIDSLEARIRWFERQVFGARSERLLSGESRQIPLFEVPETPPAETVTVKSFERSARKEPTVIDESGKARFSDSVPVDEVVVLPEEVKGLAEDSYEVIGPITLVPGN